MAKTPPIDLNPSNDFSKPEDKRDTHDLGKSTESLGKSTDDLGKSTDDLGKSTDDLKGTTEDLREIIKDVVQISKDVVPQKDEVMQKLDTKEIVDTIGASDAVNKNSKSNLAQASKYTTGDYTEADKTKQELASSIPGIGPAISQILKLEQGAVNWAADKASWLPGMGAVTKMAGEFALNPIGSILGMNQGGFTTEKEMIVGENKDGSINETSEFIKNPTGAPIQVIANEDLFRKDVPKYASGTLEGSLGMSVSSGGMGLSGSNVLEGIGTGLIAIEDTLPLIGPVLEEITADLVKFGDVIIDVVEGFNALAMKVAPYSQEISGAKAAVQVAGIEQDIQIAQEEGPELAKLFESSNYIWLDVQRILVSIAAPFLEILVPGVSALQRFMDDELPGILSFFDYVRYAFKLIVGIFTGEADNEVFIEQAAEILHRANNREKINRTDNTLLNDLIGSLNLGPTR